MEKNRLSSFANIKIYPIKPYQKLYIVIHVSHLKYKEIFE